MIWFTIYLHIAALQVIVNDSIDVFAYCSLARLLIIWFTIYLHTAALQAMINDLIYNLFAYGSLAGDC